MLPESQQAAQEELASLVVRLPQAKHAAEVFTLFAEHAEQVFAGLQHISIVLLPKDDSAQGGSAPDSTPAAAGPVQPQAPATCASGRAGKPASKAPAGDAAAPARAADSDSQGAAQAGSSAGLESLAAERASAFRAACGLTWANCCAFHIVKGRGALVQAPPAWPLACTASYHAAAVAEAPVATGDYGAHGPHFLDWKALHEQGAASIVAAPMLSCGRPVAVLCLASSQKDAFASSSRVELLCGALAPYAAQLQYTTRRKEMQAIVNDIITPVAAQLAQQKQRQLARAGGGGHKGAKSGHGSSKGGRDSDKGSAGKRSGRGGAASGGVAAAGQGLLYGEPNKDGVVFEMAAAGRGKGGDADGISHKRFESVILKSSPYDTDPFGLPTDMDLDWGDFCFNIVSMLIVYVYFSKAAVAGESLVAILLCMGVAAFDIVLLAMRWLWFEQYVNYGSVVLGVFQVYRVVVLPIANTWMSWSLLHKMELTPSYGVVALLGLLLVAFVIMGTQVRFFLHAPLQLASVLFAATSTPDICGTLLQGNTSSLRCIGMISALQLSLGLLLPSAMVYFLEARGGRRSFMPHMQAKRWQS